VKRFITAVLCAALVLGLFAGCSTEKNPYVPTGDGLTWDEDYTGPAATRPQEEADQVLSLTYYPDRSLNPFLCTDFTNRALFSLLYQGLFAINRNYEAEPMLCKRYTVSQDMQTYTFYLESATFWDGSRVTAPDAVESLRRAMESDYYKGRFIHVEEVALAEDGGVRITLDTAYEALPLLLDVPIVKRTQLDADIPAGTGPYMPDTTSSSGLRLRRNNHWWCSAQLQVYARSISLIPAQSAAQIRDEFEFFDLSLVCADPGSDRYADYRCDFELWDCENGIFLYLACQANSTVFSVPEIRTALTHAIDRDMLAETYYRGFARSATLPASPQSPYYNSTLASKYGYEPIKFAEAVNDAGLAGSSVKLLVNSDDSLRLRVARAIGDMLTECGLVVEMLELGGYRYKEALQQWNFDLCLGQTRLSANMDLSAFFHTYGELSYGGVNDSGAYALCLEALANHGNYYTLHQTVMENGLLCPVVFRSYAIYAERGLLTELSPARDNIFYYSLGRTLSDAYTEA